MSSRPLWAIIATRNASGEITGRSIIEGDKVRDPSTVLCWAYEGMTEWQSSPWPGKGSTKGRKTDRKDDSLPSLLKAS